MVNSYIFVSNLNFLLAGLPGLLSVGLETVVGGILGCYYIFGTTISLVVEVMAEEGTIVGYTLAVS